MKLLTEFDVSKHYILCYILTMLLIMVMLLGVSIDEYQII